MEKKKTPSARRNSELHNTKDQQRTGDPVQPVSRVVQEWIELSRMYKGKPGEARVLDIVKHNGKYYFVDDRMKELRNVEDFMDVIKFKTAGELLSCRLNDCIQVT